MKPMGGRTWKYWPASGPVFYLFTNNSNNPFLLFTLSIASEHITAEYLTSIPQTLRHFVFFSLFILPAMRLFTL